MYKKKQKGWFKHSDFMLIDLLLLEISFVGALLCRFGDIGIISSLIKATGHMQPYRSIMFVLLLIHIIVVLMINPYKNVLKRDSASEIKQILLYNIYVFVLLIVVLFADKSTDIFSRIAMVAFPTINVILMTIVHYFYKKALRHRVNQSKHQECMLMIASCNQAKEILEHHGKNQINTSDIVGLVLTDRLQDEMGPQEVAVTLENGVQQVPVVGDMEHLYDYALSNVVDEVLIFLDNESDIEEIAREFMSMGITVHVAINNFIQIPGATLNKINDLPVITASVNTVTTKQLVIKRIIDICCGLAGSIATILSMIVVVPMIMIQDPGPIFFRQERVGKNGRTFKIWKFRTMYKDAEARKAELMKDNKMSGLMFKMDDDPRIIGAEKKFSVGKFLRESSLDELPQSFNILMGSMSVVGTRPPTVKEYEQYEKHHKGRLATKPGLTGMWQVSGRSDITDFEEVVRLDKEYIDNFSLLLDLEIMLKTFKVVLGKEGSV